MSHSKILDRNKTALVIVDLQEAFRSVISDFPMIASKASTCRSRFSDFESADLYHGTISERFGQNCRRSFDQSAGGF